MYIRSVFYISSFLQIQLIMKLFLALFLLIVICSCKSSGDNTFENNRQLCDKTSEWRDHDGPDSCSYYDNIQVCKKLNGRLNIISRLHKGALEKGVFEGGMSSRWLEIKKESIVYFKPSGEIADKGTCSCENGVLKIDWESGANLPEKATVYFRSADTVELRYYDYPFSFNNLKYDSLKPKTNPTKILGIVSPN